MVHLRILFQSVASSTRWDFVCIHVVSLWLGGCTDGYSDLMLFAAFWSFCPIILEMIEARDVGRLESFVGLHATHAYEQVLSIGTGDCIDAAFRLNASR